MASMQSSAQNAAKIQQYHSNHATQTIIYCAAIVGGQKYSNELTDEMGSNIQGDEDEA